jgi:hypothetical protein
MIWGEWEAEYFFGGGWTGRNSLIRLEKFGCARTWFRQVAHHHGFWPQQLAVAWDQHLIAEPEGPSFISRTVARRRLDRPRS